MKPQMRHMYFFTIRYPVRAGVFSRESVSRAAGRKLLLHLRHSRHPWRSSPALAGIERRREPLESRVRIARLEQRLLEFELERQELDEAPADPGGVVERRYDAAIQRQRLEELLEQRRERCVRGRHFLRRRALEPFDAAHVQAV